MIKTMLVGNSSFARATLAAAGIGVAVLLSACASQQSGQASSAYSGGEQVQCETNVNLLKNTDFELYDEDGSRVWGVYQHARKSFDVSVNEGVVRILQEANEPWLVMRQTVESLALVGATVKYSVMTRANVFDEPPTHGWEHKAGLYYASAMGKRQLSPVTGDQTPNLGTWDWQEMSATFDVAENATGVMVGLFHQAGGWIEAKKPSLVIVKCKE